MTAARARGGGSPAGQEGLSRRLAGELLRAATAAPSMHNTQPWRFRIRHADRTIELWADPGRTLPSGIRTAAPPISPAAPPCSTSAWPPRWPAWLTATVRGIAVCPLTQPLETTDAWQVRDPRLAGEQPQMILRIGYGLPLPPGAPRRPISEILDEPEQTSSRDAGRVR